MMFMGAVVAGMIMVVGNASPIELPRHRRMIVSFPRRLGGLVLAGWAASVRSRSTASRRGR
jgi:hypothetical protein